MRRRIGVQQYIQEEQTSFEEGQSAKSGPGSQIGAVCSRKSIQGASIPSIYAQRLSMGPKYNVATCVEELGCNNTYRRSKHLSKRDKMRNLLNSTKIQQFDCSRKSIQAASIPPIYDQRLSMGPKYNVATCVEELGCNNTYRRSKHLSKRAKVPNLAHAAKSEPFAPVKVYKAHPFLQYMPRGFPWFPNTMLQHA